jgi:hypothetical protein
MVMIGKHAWDGFKDSVDGLLAVVSEARKRFPYSGLSVMPGWSSPKVLFIEEERTAPLQAAIMGALPEGTWGMSGWASIMEKGHGIALHDHRYSIDNGIKVENEWAGVLWLTVPRASSPLVFPDGGGGDGDGEEIEVKPQVGHFVMFPAMASHEAGSQRATGVRTSISFNVWPKRDGA